MKRLATALALLGFGCGSSGEPTGAESLGARSQAVIGGIDSTEADDGVLVIRTDRPKDTSVCSASLVAPNLLLTARHCIVAEYPADNIRCNSDGTLMEPSGGQLGVASAPEKIRVFSGATPAEDTLTGLPGGEPAAIAAQVVTTDWPSVCRDDVALIVLDRDLSLPVIPMSLGRDLTRSTLISVVGYGVTETSTESDRWSPRKRHDRLSIKYIDTLPNTFALGPSVCKGDSGGPALDADTGAILGVYSLGIPGQSATDCRARTALNYYAHVNRYQDLLRRGFEAAGQPFPGTAPLPGEAGAGGAAPEPTFPSGGEQGDAGAGGEPSAEPTSSDSPRASGGCSLRRPGSSGDGGLVLLFAFAALRRRLRR